jgi:hypothetical protein
MSFEINGRLTEKFETQKVSDRFQKREFVLEIKSTSETPVMNLLTLSSSRPLRTDVRCWTSLALRTWLKSHSISEDESGRKDGQVSYFTNLEAWRIEKVPTSQTIQLRLNRQDSIYRQSTGSGCSFSFTSHLRMIPVLMICHFENLKTINKPLMLMFDRSIKPA